MNKDLTECHYCKARYRPQEWFWGYYIGTSSHFNVMGTIKKNQCPVCRREQDTNQQKDD